MSFIKGDVSAAVVRPGRTLFGHPIGLFVLFFTEMWERFSYYGMRALLVLYMVNYFKWTQEDASNIYKWYTSLVYLTPLLGGFLADRVLGNKWAIIIGAILMAIGHFCMAFEQIEIFYAALIFLIIGNGFFKPNMSTQVGRLYPANDPRRDGAYTIFYMGINLGAFLSPIVCGALMGAPGFGFHWGFGAAGVGMVVGLLIYLFGLPLIRELPPDAQYEGPLDHTAKAGHAHAEHALTETEAEKAASAIPRFARLSPTVFALIGSALLLGSPLLGWLELTNWDNVVALEIAAVCSFIAGWILSRLSMAVRDRVLAIYALAVFVVFFWGAFEQAGNAMNVWADKTTDRYLTEAPPAPAVVPEVAAEERKMGVWEGIQEAFVTLARVNPVATTNFQSINAAAIVLFAPLFAWFWVFLVRRGINLSIAGKMSIGVFLVGMAFALMIWAARVENQPSQTTLVDLPRHVMTRADGSLEFIDAPEFDPADESALKEFLAESQRAEDKMVAHGGRLKFDPTSKTLSMTGVLNDNHRDRMLRATVPKDYLEAVWRLAQKTHEAKTAAAKGEQETFTVEFRLPRPPPGYDLSYAGFSPDKVRFEQAAGNIVVVNKALADKDYKAVLVAGADPTFRNALNDLFVKSSDFKVSSAWLFWFYILCTLGELCLSPVGLSMVSKLAPKKFATMLMGMWLLTSFFGNFSAGLAGENWELISPAKYFTYITLALVGASAVCFLIARRVTAMMHGVR